MSTQQPWGQQPQGWGGGQGGPGGFGGQPQGPGGFGGQPPQGPGGYGPPPGAPPQGPGGYGGQPPQGPGGYGPPPGAPGGPSGGPGGFGGPQGFGGPPPPFVPQQPKKRRAGLVVGIVVLLAVLGGGAVFAMQLIRGSGGDALVAHVPDDAVAYGHVNLNPSAGQKLGVAALVDRINEAAGEDVIDLGGLLSDFEMDTDVSFAEDIDPWLGDQVAVFARAFPGVDLQTLEETPASFAVVLAVDDEDAAARLIDEEAEDVEPWDAGEGRRGWQLEDGPDGAAIVAGLADGRLYIGTPDAVTDGLDTTEGLGASEAYTTAVEGLPDRIATGWLAVPALVEQTAPLAGQAVPTGMDLPETVAFAVSVGPDAVDITATTTGGTVVGTDSVAPADLAALPAGGLFYALVPDLGSTLPQLAEQADGTAAAAAEASGEELPDELRPSTAIDEGLDEALDTSLEDLAGLLGDLTIAVAYDPASDTDNTGIEVAVGVADEDRAADLLDRALEPFAEAAGQEGVTIEPGRAVAGDLVVEVADGRFAIEAGSFPGEGTLAEDEAFTAAVDGLTGRPVLYVDVRRIVDAVAVASPPDEEDQRVADILGAFDQLVGTYEVAEGDVPVTTAAIRLTYGSELQPVEGGGGEPALPDLDFGSFGSVEELLGAGDPIEMLQGSEPLTGSLEDPTTGPTGTAGQPFTFGDDPRLDELWLACEGGDFVACDDLFFESPVDSDYELFALTCGDRGEPTGQLCEELHGSGGMGAVSSATTIDPAALEQFIRDTGDQQAADRGPWDADCTGIPTQVAAGDVFECTAIAADGATFPVTVTAEDDQGNVNIRF